jgi:multidrug efflux system outer membrane protein
MKHGVRKWIQSICLAVEKTVFLFWGQSRIYGLKSTARNSWDSPRRKRYPEESVAAADAGIKRKFSKKYLVTGVIVLAMLLIAGCAVGPNYVRPEVPVPAQWSAELQDGLEARSPNPEVLANWWMTLDDPVLNNLIKRAIAGNLDLRQAVARIREARASLGISRSGFFPTVDSSGARTRSRSSEQTGGGRKSTAYNVGLDASWELDIFGGVRRSVEASTAELEASEDDLRDVLVTLLSEVALNYVDVRTYQSRLAVTQSNLQLQQETYELTTARFEAGLSSQIDMDQAKYNLENTRAQIPALRTGLGQAKNRIAVLLGGDPGAVDAGLSETQPIPTPPLEVAVGVPAEVLRQRPDIRRAERQLAAQTARIGVATADLYPRFQLFGSIGLDSLAFSDLFLGSSRSWRYGPSFSWPIFTAGRIRQNIEVQDAIAEQALIQYESTILAALEDVENALIGYVNVQVRRDALEQAVQAASRAADLAEMQYASGLVDFQVVLDAQRALLSAQEQLSVSEGEIVSNLISIYKALGGGWTSLASTET